LLPADLVGYPTENLQEKRQEFTVRGTKKQSTVEDSAYDIGLSPSYP
jgi:hypothetical protein